MKKSITSLLLGAVCLTAGAQTTLQRSRFFDNWSVGLNGGGLTTLHPHYSFFPNMRGAVGLEVTKMITPVFGLAAQGNFYVNTSASKNAFDLSNISLLGKFNLMNAIGGYKGSPRLFEIEAVAGMGWMHAFVNSGNTLNNGSDSNTFSTKYGLNFNFNLGQDKAWTVSFKPAVQWDMIGRTTTLHRGGQTAFTDGKAWSRTIYDQKNAMFELMAGVTYHFKTSNGSHHFALAKAYDQAEVDRLNGTINELRAQVADKDTRIDHSNRTINDLQRELNDCRNQKPAPVAPTVSKQASSLESVITFAQGKATVATSQLPNVERIATYLKKYKDAKVLIKGYASPEGGAAINAKLAANRAQAVKKILMNKYHIASSRIVAEGQGVGNMFSEPDWNRVAICTISEAQ